MNSRAELEAKFRELYRQLSFEHSHDELTEAANIVYAQLAAANMADLLRANPGLINKKLSLFPGDPSGLFVLMRAEYGRYMFEHHADLLVLVSKEAMSLSNNAGATPLLQFVSHANTLTLLGHQNFSADFIDEALFNQPLDEAGRTLASTLLCSQSGLNVLLSRPDIVIKIGANSINARYEMIFPMCVLPNHECVNDWGVYPVLAFVRSHLAGAKLLRQSPELRDKISPEADSQATAVLTARFKMFHGGEGRKKMPAPEEQARKGRGCVLQ